MEHRRLQGRVSCWVLGGIGCLGALIIVIVAAVLGGRALINTVGKPVEEALAKAQLIVSKQRAVYNALQRYSTANNGKYPQSLKQLVPKYVPEDPTRPIPLNDGTEVRLVYKPPKPNAAPDTVILEHKPPIKSTMTILGQKVDIEFTYQVQLNGEVYQQQVIIDPQGNKQTQRQLYTR
jgi:hypothetical protein